MKKRMRILVGIALSFVVGVGSAPAQVELSENPFPDVIARSAAVRPFDLNAKKITLKGVVTEEPKRIKPPKPYHYFRMAVKEDSAPNGVTIWAVLLWSPQTPSLKVGTPVSVLGTPTKDGSRRVELVQGPSSGPTADLTELRIGER